MPSSTCTCCVPQRFYVTQQRDFGDRHLYGSLTRFIPPTVAAEFERVGPAQTSDVRGPVYSMGDRVAVNIGARLRSA